MEARDSRSKIRPLPIDEIDGGGLPPHRADTPRRWLPLVVIVAGAIAFGIVARGLGPARSPEAGAATTTTTAAIAAEPDVTTTTLPPPPPPEPLARMLPIAEDGLQLVALDISARIGRWDPDAAFPTYTATVSQPERATYNSSGSHFAVSSRTGDGSIVIDGRESFGPILIAEGVSSGEWHPIDPDLFAWTSVADATDPALTHLRIADISGYTGTTLEPLREIELPGAPQVLLAWGDWGFITQDSTPGADQIVTLYDADGFNPLQLEGDFFGATPSGLVLMAVVEESGYVPYIVELDRSLTPLVGLDIGASQFRITSDGEWVIALTLQADGHTSILARTVRSRSTRLSSINGAGRLVSFVLDDRFIAIQERDTRDLVFKDWNTGAEFRIPIAGGESIADVDL